MNAPGRIVAALRAATFVAGGAFAVHELSYLAGPGSADSAALQGHSYLSGLLPALAVLAALTLLATVEGGLAARRARRRSRSASEPLPGLPFAASRRSRSGSRAASPSPPLPVDRARASARGGSTSSWSRRFWPAALRRALLRRSDPDRPLLNPPADRAGDRMASRAVEGGKHAV